MQEELLARNHALIIHKHRIADLSANTRFATRLLAFRASLPAPPSNHTVTDCDASYAVVQSTAIDAGVFRLASPTLTINYCNACRDEKARC